MKIDFNKIRMEVITLNQNDKLVKQVYEESFPANEKLDFENLFSGVFKDFVLYGFYLCENLVGFVHLANKEEFVHLNYLAVSKKYRSCGIGSYIIRWVKNQFNNKSLVADVENLDSNAENNEQRIKRLKFYYKNGFRDGITEFDWEGTKMYYIHTNDISDDEFMKYIKVCFPTIKNLKPHKSNLNEVENRAKN